jgi:hypothetical protein
MDRLKVKTLNDDDAINTRPAERGCPVTKTIYTRTSYTHESNTALIIKHYGNCRSKRDNP